LAEELHAQAMIRQADIGGVLFITDASHPLPVSAAAPRSDQVVELDRPTCTGSGLISVLLDLKGVDTCFQAGSVSAIQAFVSSASCTHVVWPPLDTVDEKGRIDYKYATTLFLQRFCREHGSIPTLSVKAQPLQWALEFIRGRVVPSLPVAVHLKYQPDQQGYSNANFEEWLAFLEASIARFDVKFILIGDDEIDGRIRALPNVLVSRHAGSTLATDLALIQTSFAFVGMATGPCNMALFSETPYVIYKNPGHDAEEMLLELGDSDRFSFARPFQRVLRMFETRENLLAEFAHIYAHVSRQVWETRLSKLVDRSRGQ